MNRMHRIAFAAALAFGLLAAVALGYWWGRVRGETPVAADDAAGDGRKVLYWYDPMMPDQRFDKPGKSPFMDMQLVPRYADQKRNGPTGVRIDPGVQQNLGIRSARVELGNLDTRIRVPATLAWDLGRESLVSAPVDALLSRLHVKAPYTPVRRGQALATVLAPEWGAAIAESRALERAGSADARALQPAARQRLRMLGLSGTTAGGDGSVLLRAPHDGVVSEIMVREGQAAMAGMPLLRINGTETLWLEAAIPQAATAGIGPGTPVEATVSALPGHRFSGEVDMLLPQVDATSRTQRARVVLRNDEGLLAPGMFAELELRPETGSRRPLVPTDALIATGDDVRVIVMADNGSFLPVRVRIGRSGGGRTEILEGLSGGERIVTSGQFLIDSEASLSGALERLRPTADDSALPAAAGMDRMETEAGEIGGDESHDGHDGQAPERRP
jgi:membrane fusion protein, copper/silver efflux system